MSFLENLPDMFVANIPDNTCIIPEGVDFEFPTPGDYVATGSIDVNVKNVLKGDGCSTVTKMGAGAGTMTPPQQATGGSSGPKTSAVVQPPVETVGSPIDSPVPVMDPLDVPIMAVSETPVPEENPVPVTTRILTLSTVMAPRKSPIPALPKPSRPDPFLDPEASIPTPPSDQAQANGSIDETSVPCTKDGELICIGTTSFGLCDRGSAIPQALAAGTLCRDGAIIHADEDKNIVAARRVIHAHAHGHGHGHRHAHRGKLAANGRTRRIEVSVTGFENGHAPRAPKPTARIEKTVHGFENVPIRSRKAKTTARYTSRKP